MTRDDINLMAPVGSYESLMTAIEAGADSVYFGVGKLNMRSRSSHNFDLDDLHNIVSTCLKHDVKTYLTVNTVVYAEEIEYMQKVVNTAKHEGISAIIASDMSVINHCRKINMEVHASTQMNISNAEAVRFYADYCDVMVTARELNLTQVKHITKTIADKNITGPSGNQIKIEIFIHGALCMAISGKCYLSLHEFNTSANRGECYQTCRRAYEVRDKESGYQLDIDNEYIMSPKDLKTIDFLDEILDAGVTVLKIEGRARSPEYVKTVTETYNAALNAYVDKSWSQDKVQQWNNKLKTVFNRGFWDGYYLGQKLGEWADKYGNKSTSKKRYIGKGMNYFDNIQVADFLLEAGELHKGDNILITGPTTGVIEHTVDEIRVDDKVVETAPRQSRCSFKLNKLIRRSDKLYRIEPRQ
ncbi:MAG: U32 family peptidase [Candidatus Delongbacteria bacterium]|jgi:putative protease|nr:U32 family peptidase [Candidatus Delongbacteria bacterium]